MSAAALTEGQIAEFREVLLELKQTATKWKDEAVVARITQLESELKSIRKRLLASVCGDSATRPKGTISDTAARALGTAFILHCQRSGKLESVIPREDDRRSLLTEARQFAAAERSLSTSEIPLPTVYSSELIELIAEFGVLRNQMTAYPMAGGTNKPPRMGTRPAFGSIAMAAEFPEKKPTLTFASLESHKVGGVVITPREIEEQSIVMFGKYLANYGAVEFARAEDTWGLLADGSGTYENVKGVVQICRENNKKIVLASGKTKPSDTTLDEFRNLRGVVSTAALSNGKYYINQTWEGPMRSFNTIGSNYIFQYLPDGTATLDGFRIVWTEVMTPYGTAAAADSPIAVFGNLRFWWFGMRGSPRIDASQDVYFTSDQIATRFIEELDFDYNSLQAAAALITAAS